MGIVGRMGEEVRGLELTNDTSESVGDTRDGVAHDAGARLRDAGEALVLVVVHVDGSGGLRGSMLESSAQ